MVNAGAATKEGAVDELMLELMKELDVAEPERLLQQFLRERRGLKELREKLLERMKPDEPPKTVRTTFGELRLANKFIGQPTGWKYMVIARSLVDRVALALEGEREGYVVSFHLDAPVDKIIE